MPSSGRRVYQDHRSDMSLEVVRAMSALFSVVSLTAVTDLPDSVRVPAVTAHVGVIVVSAVAVLALPRLARAGRDRLLGPALTAGTILFYVVTTAMWHDVAGAGTALGVLALCEAPLRYGWRGAALSGFPVLWTALLFRQVDATGATLSEGVIVTLVALLLAGVLTVREVMRRSVQALTGAAQGFAGALLHLPVGVAVVDEQGRVTQANPALSDLLGVVEPGLPLAERLAPGLSAADSAALERAVAGEAPDARVVCRTPDGREVTVGAALVRVPGPRRVVVHVQDVTAERRERADLLHASRHDALTGLLTRQAGSQALAEALAGDPGVAVLFLDLDGFKSLNDTAGHAVGDVVLRQVASRIAGALRPSEQAVRWGGDEFVVVCSGVRDVGQMEAVAHRLLAVLREPFRVPGLPLVTLTASIGAARADTPSSPAALLAAADEAMYEAKRAGGDRWAASPVLPPAREPERNVLDLRRVSSG